jgi:phage protein D
MVEVVAVPAPTFRLTYNRKDITHDITPYVLEVTYTDNLRGQSDDIEIKIEDVDGRWIEAWYPGKGDSLSLSIGYEGQPLLNCGIFEIDEIEWSDKPSVISIKALATPVNKPLRTRNNRAFEETTLPAVAQQIAAAQGMKVVGDIEAVPIGRVTQYGETDVGFLKRMAEEYGYAFKVNGDQLVFTQMAKLRSQAPVAVFHRGDAALKVVRLPDKITRVYAGVTVSHHDPKKKALVVYNLKDGGVEPSSSGGRQTSADTLYVHRRADTPAQAEALARGALEANEERVNGSVTVIGDPRLVAGVVIELAGCGKFSGVLLVHSARHSMSRSGGYETSLELKRGLGDGSQREKSKKKGKKDLVIYDLVNGKTIKK